MDKPPGIKPNIFVRLALFLVSAAVVLSAVAVVVFRERINLDALRRWFTYRSLSLSDSGQAQSFPYSGSYGDVFVDMDGDLLVCGHNGIGLYSGSGVQYVDMAVNMDAPAAETGGGCAVVYDAGGSELYVFRQRALAFSLDSDGPLLSARLNRSGLLTVVSHQPGFRGVVTLYDASFQPTLSIRLSSTYVMDARLLDNGRTLVLLTIGQEGGDFRSSLLFYELGALGDEPLSYDAAPAFSCPLGGDVILSLAQDGARLWALGGQGLYVLDQRGELLETQSWADRHLKAYCLEGDGFAVALLAKYRAGSQAQLAVVDGGGGLTGSLPLEESVLSVDAAGRYFAVLTADRLDIYTRDMALYSSLSGIHGARRVLLRPDGSAILISAGTARLYVPA